VKRLLLSVLFLCSCTWAQSLDVMTAITRQDPSLDWWYAVPQGFTPQIRTITSVPKGEYFNIIPFFKIPAAESNGTARITFDIQVLRPDGSVDTSIKGCKAKNGRINTQQLIASEAILRTCFDAEDPYGLYTIKITAYDQAGGTTNSQIKTIEQVPFRIEKLEATECDTLFTEYVSAPDPSTAFAAFLQTEHSFFDENKEPIWAAIWFFKTVFDKNDYLLPHLLSTFPKGTPKQQRDIILLLSLLNETNLLPKLSGDLRAFRKLMEAGRVPDPYDDVRTGKQLDMLWAEYFATGTVEPVRHIISALKLVEYSGTLEKIKAGELNPEDPDVYRRGQLEAVFQAALWSLKSNFRKSPLVYAYSVGILDSEKLEKPTYSCLAMLLQSMTANDSIQPSEEKK